MNQTLVHLHYEASPGTMAVACLQNNTIQYEIMGARLSHPSYQLSGEPRAVTCPLCKKSSVFRDAQARLDEALRGSQRGS